MLNKIFILIMIIVLGYFIYNNTEEHFKNLNISQPIKNKIKSKLTQIKQSNKSQNNNKLNNTSINMSIENLDSNKTLNDTKSYDDILESENKDLIYYYNDIIDQSKINETASNIINQTDVIDYSNVETGLTKCNKNCKGICYEMGYTGIATCYPLQTTKFDWGTLYKNPTFTYSYNAYNEQQ